MGDKEIYCDKFLIILLLYPLEFFTSIVVTLLNILMNQDTWHDDFSSIVQWLYGFYSVGSLLIIRVFSSFGDAGVVGHVLNMTLNNMKQRIWEYISRIVRTVLCSESSKIKSIFTKPPVIFDRTYPCKCPF